MHKYVCLVIFGTLLFAQDLTPEEILTYVAANPKPESSITEIRLEISREKRKKRSRFENLLDTKKYISQGNLLKSLARFPEQKL